MAVYTEVPDDALKAFLDNYEIGELLAVKGIAEGVENSNFLLRTRGGAFILTLYEKRVREADLPFFLGLLEHLAARGLCCPQPVRNREGTALGRLAGRPAAIVSFVEGVWVSRPTAEHCRAVGEALGHLHRAGADFPMRRDNALSLAGWTQLERQVEPNADAVLPGLSSILQDELAHLRSAWPTGLPTGVIHADLFPDNVFFLGAELSGLIDFYFACTDFLAYDVAICLNAWCFEPDQSFDLAKGRALLDGYARVRPLGAGEIGALPTLARGAALRFALTRLFDWLNVPAGAMVKPKDPLEYVRKLRFHQGVEGVAGYGLSP
jgi:homoserine kinase type II